MRLSSFYRRTGTSNGVLAQLGKVLTTQRARSGRTIENHAENTVDI